MTFVNTRLAGLSYDAAHMLSTGRLSQCIVSLRWDTGHRLGPATIGHRVGKTPWPSVGIVNHALQITYRLIVLSDMQHVPCIGRPLLVSVTFVNHRHPRPSYRSAHVLTTGQPRECIVSLTWDTGQSGNDTLAEDLHC